MTTRSVAEPTRAETTCPPSISPTPGRTSSTRPLRVRADGLTTTGAVDRHRRAEGGHRPGGEGLRDLGGLGVAGEHGRRPPRRPSRRRPSRGPRCARPRSTPVGERRRATLSSPAKRADSGSASRSSARSARAAACLTSTRFEATPMSRLARAPDRISPVHVGRPTDGRRGQVLGERGDVEAVVVGEPVGLGHDPPDVGLEALVVAAVHPQERGVGGQEGAQLGLVGPDALDQGLGIVGDGGPVAVADGEVLGPHAGPVGRPPPEGGAVDGGGHAPPHHRVVEPGLAQELGHLGDVAEHVGQVADVHRPPEGGRPFEAHLEVADEGLAGDEELVGERRTTGRRRCARPPASRRRRGSASGRTAR